MIRRLALLSLLLYEWNLGATAWGAARTALALLGHGRLFVPHAAAVALGLVGVFLALLVARPLASRSG